jgi:uncharacterized RDD family membrane protein YckC
MFCTECGISISSTIKFCGNCGTPLEHQTVEQRELVRRNDEPISGPDEIPNELQSDTYRLIETRAEKSVGSNVSKTATIRPWVRYWARITDIIIFSLIVGVGFGFLAPELFQDSDFDRVFGIIAVVFALVLEAICFTVVGSTPGKKFFKINLVTQNGQTLSIGDVIARNFHLWWRGLGCGIPLISLVTLIFAYRDLTSTGTTAWDRDSKVNVVHGTFGIWRWFIFACFMFVVFLLLSVP